MNEIHTLFMSRNFKHYTLSVKFVEKTEKALKFQVLGNWKCYVYFPIKAVKFGDDNIHEIAHWFTPSPFTWDMIRLYGDVCKA